MTENTVQERAGDAPARTCVGCRAEHPQGDLLRLVAGPGGEPVPDPKRRLPGRGAYVAYDPRCVLAAAKTGRLARSLRLPRSPAPAALLATVRAAQDRRIADILGVARKAGALAIGASGLSRSLERGAALAVVVASDAAETTAREAEEAARRAGAAVLRWGAKRRLGELFGRADVAVAAVGDRGFARSLAREYDRWKALGAEDTD